jgi:hypothetical protein
VSEQNSRNPSHGFLQYVQKKRGGWGSACISNTNSWLFPLAQLHYWIVLVPLILDGSMGKVIEVNGTKHAGASNMLVPYSSGVVNLRVSGPLEDDDTVRPMNDGLNPGATRNGMKRVKEY